MKGRNIHKLNRSEIAAMIAAGKTRREIADRYDVSLYALQHSLNQMDLSGQNARLQQSIKPETILADLVKGLNPSRIAARRCSTLETVNALIETHDLMAKMEQILVESGANKIITPYRLTNVMTGGSVITHISRPRISMHVKALQERRA